MPLVSGITQCYLPPDSCRIIENYTAFEADYWNGYVKYLEVARIIPEWAIHYLKLLNQ